MPRALIGLGANLGDRQRTLDRAVRELARLPGVERVRPSRWYASPAVGGPVGQPEFLNAAAACETSLAPGALLVRLQAVEAAAGRRRETLWGPRTLDLDLLLYGDEVLVTPDLTVPHPRMAFRRFVLAPAADVAAHWPDPRDGQTILGRLTRLRLEPDYVAISAPVGQHAEPLARRVAERYAGRVLHDPIAAAGTAGLEPSNAGPTRSSPIDSCLHAVQSRVEAVRDALAAAGGGLVVGDYWIEAASLQAHDLLTWRERLCFERERRLACRDLATPKLLATVDAPGRPPVEPAAALRLSDASAGDGNLAELVAAIGAMRAEPVLAV